MGENHILDRATELEVKGWGKLSFQTKQPQSTDRPTVETFVKYFTVFHAPVSLALFSSWNGTLGTPPVALVSYLPSGVS